MNGRKAVTRNALISVLEVTATGTYVFTATQRCSVYLYAWGSGAGGNNGGPGSSGASGATGFKKYKLVTDQRLTLNIGVKGLGGAVGTGTKGTDTTVTDPSGLIATAGAGDVLPGAGGVASGFDVNRSGSIQGVAGLFGAAPGTGLNSLGGAGAPGWTDINSLGVLLSGGRGGNADGGSALYGGGGAGALSSAGGDGGNGRVVLIVTQA
jgi:hypothetical protein